MKTTKKDVLEMMDAIDRLLAADKDDPNSLITALRHVTLHAITVGGLTDSNLLKGWVINLTDVCTAYVQDRMVRKTDDPYRAVVEEYRGKIGELALTEIP